MSSLKTSQRGAAKQTVRKSQCGKSNYDTVIEEMATLIKMFHFEIRLTVFHVLSKRSFRNYRLFFVATYKWTQNIPYKWPKLKSETVKVKQLPQTREQGTACCVCLHRHHSDFPHHLVHLALHCD